MAELGGLLGDYGSDGSSADESDHTVPVEDPQGTSQAKTGAPETSTSLLNRLPPPKTNRSSVGFVLPLNRAALVAGDSSEEDEPTVHIPQKASNPGRRKIFDYLPAPRNMSYRTGGFEASQVGKTVQDDSKRGSDESAATESCDLPNNEMYRVDTHGDEMAVLPDSQLMGGNVSGKQFLASGDDVFTEEVLAPSDGQGKSRKRTFEELGMEFTEISQEELKYGSSASIDATDGIGDALGSEYASSLLKQSTPFKGSKLAKRKHQIGTLYHDMKMNELKTMASKSQGVKSKHETEAKYGWR